MQLIQVQPQVEAGSSSPEHPALGFKVIIHETRGHPTEEQVEAFLAAGYTKKSVLEAIVGASLKVVSNYTTPIVVPELDDAFKPMTWRKDMASAT